MAAAPYIRTFVRQALKEGMSRYGAEQQFRREGGKIGRENWAGVWGEITSQLALAPEELGKRLNQIPYLSEMHTVTSAKLRPGIIHEVKVIGRMRNGTIVTKDVPVWAGNSPMQRLKAIRTAEEWARGFFSEESPVDTDIVQVYGGVYLGTARRIRTA